MARASRKSQVRGAAAGAHDARGAACGHHLGGGTRGARPTSRRTIGGARGMEPAVRLGHRRGGAGVLVRGAMESGEHAASALASTVAPVAFIKGGPEHE